MWRVVVVVVVVEVVVEVVEVRGWGHGSAGCQPNARMAQQERPAWLSGMFKVVERAKGVRCGGFCLPLWLPL